MYGDLRVLLLVLGSSFVGSVALAALLAVGGAVRAREVARMEAGGVIGAVPRLQSLYRRREMLVLVFAACSAPALRGAFLTLEGLGLKTARAPFLQVLDVAYGLRLDDMGIMVVLGYALARVLDAVAWTMTRAGLARAANG